MKRYIKSDSAVDIIRQNQTRPEGGYLYIFKHGIGPGTLPRDVEVIRTKDLPNSYTAVWTDRFLTTSELKEYDIPSETEINRYLDRIGYCQKGGDVVPCDEVEACDTVIAAKSSKSDILDRYAGKDIWLKVKISQKAYFRRGYTNDQYWIRIVDKDEDGNYVINRVSSYREYKGNSTQKQRTLSNTYTVNKNSITLFNPIQTTTTDKIFDVEACDKVTASTKPHPKIPEGWERVPEGDDDDGNWGTIAKALPDNQGYYWINIIEDEQGRRCFELEVGYRGDNGAIGEIWKAASKPFYRLGDIVKYADIKWRQLQNEYDEDIEACGDIKASKTYHFYRHNGESYTTEPDGTKVLSRKVLQRNVLDMLEDNDKYMNLDFCDAEEITEQATPEELLAIYDEEMTSEEFKALYTRVFGVEACGDIKASRSIKADGVPNYRLSSYMGAMLKKFTINLSVYGEGGPIYDLEESYSGSLRDCINHMITYQKKVDAEGLDADLSLEPWDMTGQSSRDFRGDCRSILNDLLDEDYITEDEYDEYMSIYSSINASTNPKYMANMVSCSSEDGYEQLAEGIPETSDYYDDPDHFKYYVAGYYDGNKRGLASSFDTDDFDAVLEGAHDMAAQGFTVVITNSETGIEVVYSPDVWMNAIDDGEYPSGVYSIM